MRNCKKLILLLIAICVELSAQNQQSEGLVILDRLDFPFIFELDTGESQIVKRNYQGATVERTIKLIGFEAFSETNYWFSDPLPPMDYYQFKVDLEVSGERVALYHRPYQMPVVVNGIRIYIENMKEWGEDPRRHKLGGMTKQVRIAVCMENEPWGPDNIIFPVNDYRWHANVYMNTWSSLVPYNFLYYHRGEDYGAIPDKHDLESPISGRIIVTPLSNEDRGSNEIIIRNNDGLEFGFYHMDIETIIKDYPVNSTIEAGDVFAKTGMTWDGRKAQGDDPHVHVDLAVDGIKLASYPYLMEAYLRKYNDPVLAIAGGYRFAEVGEKVVLDAERSFARDMSPLKKYRWTLSNGVTVENAQVTISYNKPGLYTEELLVETKEGYQDRDFLNVRVYDPKRGKNIAFGWAYYYPLRGIKPGTPVLFWSRLRYRVSDVQINFGDDSAWETMGQETTHIYKDRGNYVVTLKSTGPDNEPLTLKMEVVVE
jgi:hypothetical protein